MFQTVLNKLTKSASGKEIANGSLIFFLTKIIGIVLTYIFTFWVTRTMGAGKWGYFALCMNSLSTLSMIALFGFDTFLVRHISEYHSKSESGKIKDIYFWTAALSILFSVLICVSIATFSKPYSSLFFNNPGMKPWMLTVSVGIPGFTLFQLNNAVISGMRRMLLYGFFQNILVFGLTIALFFSLQETLFPRYFDRFMQGGILLLVTYIVVIYLSLAANSIYLFLKLKLFEVQAEPTVPVRSILQHSYPFFTSSILLLFMTSSGLYFLGAMKNETEVGIFDITCKISNILNLTLVSVAAIVTPKYSEYFSQGKMQLLAQTTRQASKLLFWSSLPVLVGILIFRNELLTFFGEEFKIGASALVILSFGNFISVIFGTVGTLLKMTDHQKAMQNFLLAATALNLVLNFLLIPPFGFLGAAIANAVSVIFWNSCGVWFVHKKLGILTIYLPFSK